MEDIDSLRRLLVFTAAAGSIVPSTVAVAGNGAGAASAVLIVPDAVVPGSVPGSTELKAAFQNLKNIVKSANAWNTTFDTSYMASSESALKEVAAEESKRFYHNVRLVEQLLGEISVLVDRCIAYRKEGEDLEIQGIASGMNKYVTFTFDEKDLEQAKIDSSFAMASVLADKFASAASALNSDPNDKGTRLQLDALGAGNKEFANAQSKRLAWQIGRMKQTQELNRMLIGRYDTPGSAHNFAERFDRLRKFFEQDIVSAYRRALAAKEGMWKIYFKKIPLPDIEREDFLDEMVLWTRECMRYVARISETEFEITKQFKVSINRSAAGGGKIGQFTIGDKNLAKLGYVRLREIGATFSYSGDPLKETGKTTASFKLLLLKGFTSDGQTPSEFEFQRSQPRTFVALNMKAEGAYAPDFVGGTLCYNLDPQGTWDYRVADAWTNYGGDNSMASGSIPDWVISFNIYMRIATSINDVPETAKAQDYIEKDLISYD